jgi:hypothetical protein
MWEHRRITTLWTSTTCYRDTYLRSWALLEELSIVQPLKNSPAFYGTRRFNTCSQEPSTGPYLERYQSYLRSILILSTNLRLGLPSGLFPSGFPTNILYAFLFSPFVLHALPISSWLDYSNYSTWRRVQVNFTLFLPCPLSFTTISNSGPLLFGPCK